MFIKETVEILDVPFIHTTKKEFLYNIVFPKVDNENKCFIVTANPEIVMYAKENPSYLETLLKADYVVADGIGIIIASKMLNKTLPERIAGIELMEDMLVYANKHRKSVYLFGAKDHVVKKTVENISRKYPNVKIAGYHHGYVDIEDETVFQQIKETEPDFVFVALGYPKQEEWININKDRLSKGIFMGVGGSFDILAGAAKRAPNIFIKLNLEWLYRLMSNPSRFGRMLKLPKFIIHILRGK